MKLVIALAAMLVLVTLPAVHAGPLDEPEAKVGPCHILVKPLARFGPQVHGSCYEPIGPCTIYIGPGRVDEPSMRQDCV